jgi:hypothetical protein
MAVKTGRAIMAHPNYRHKRCALELLFPRHDYFLLIQGSLQLVNISKMKAEAGSSLCLPVPVI